MTEIWNHGERPVSRPFPWPPAEGEPVLGAFGETWKSATFDPAAFFRHTPRDAGIGPAVLYYLVIGIMVAGASLFWNTLTGVARVGDAMAAELGIAAVQPLVTFFLAPVILLSGLVLAAGATHLFLLLLGGATHGFGTSIRVFCYAYSPMLFGVVPVLGTVIGVIWMLGIAIIGLREAHATEGWKPAVAVLVPFLVLMGSFLLALVVYMATAGVL